MTVYVDLLFGVNTLINYLLLRGSAALGGCPVRLWRTAAASVLGGAYAVAVVLPGLQDLQRVPAQISCAMLMLMITFGFKRNTLKQALFFFCLSFAFGGIVLLAVQLAEPDLLLLEGRAYYAVSTPALLLLAGLCYGLAAVVLSGCGTHTGGDLVPVTLMLEGRAVQLRALRDTGNTLRDPVTGQPVLIADNRILAQLLPAAQLPRDPTQALSELSWQYPKLRFRLIPYRAVGVDAGLLPAVRCSAAWKGKQQSVLTAFSPTPVSADGQFDAIWGGEIQ